MTSDARSGSGPPCVPVEWMERLRRCYEAFRIPEAAGNPFVLQVRPGYAEAARTLLAALAKAELDHAEQVPLAKGDAELIFAVCLTVPRLALTGVAGLDLATSSVALLAMLHGVLDSRDVQVQFGKLYEGLKYEFGDPTPVLTRASSILGGEGREFIQKYLRRSASDQGCEIVGYRVVESGGERKFVRK